MRRIIVVLLSLLVFLPRTSNAEVFPQYQKLEKKDVELQLRLNAKNAEKLMDVVGRAKAQRLGDVAFAALRKLKKQQSSNAVVMATFYHATDTSLKWYQPGFEAGTPLSQKQRLEDNADRREGVEALERAAQLAPNLWLVPLNQGTRLYKTAYSARQPSLYKEAIPLLRKALKLAPKNTRCWNAYGGALGFMAQDKQILDGKIVVVKDSVAAFEAAGRIDPSRGAWSTLFNIYHFQLKDRKNALRCKREYLKRFPRDRKIDPIYKSWFALYPA